jgi:hypothetical protein
MVLIFALTNRLPFATLGINLTAFTAKLLDEGALFPLLFQEGATMRTFNRVYCKSFIILFYQSLHSNSLDLFSYANGAVLPDLEDDGRGSPSNNSGLPRGLWEVPASSEDQGADERVLERSLNPNAQSRTLLHLGLLLSLCSPPGRTLCSPWGKSDLSSLMAATDFFFGHRFRFPQGALCTY